MSAVLTLTGGGFGTCTVGWVTRVPFSLGRLRGIQLSPLGTPGTARLSRGEVTVMATLVTKELQVAQGTAQPGSQPLPGDSGSTEAALPSAPHAPSAQGLLGEGGVVWGCGGVEILAAGRAGCGVEGWSSPRESIAAGGRWMRL